MRPFQLPDIIEERLRPLHVYWRGLRRAANEMPFWDDLELSELAQISDNLVLIDAFEKPQRFRLSVVGRKLADCYGKDLTGAFINEVEPRAPFDFLNSQSSASAESRSPTYYEHGGSHDPAKARGYARILLPLWGEGSVRMLLGAVAWKDAGASSGSRRG
jgi:hypothetical protein